MSLRVMGVLVFWIVLVGYAFGGSFNLEAGPGGDLGFASYSEAGLRAPAAPVAPRAPGVGAAELAPIAALSLDERADGNDGARTTALALLESFAGSQLQHPLLNLAPARDSNRLSADTLATIVRNVRLEVYSDSRLAYMERAVGDRKLNVEQLSTMLGLLTFSDDRLALVRQLGSRVEDSENYPSLYRYFPFETDRETLAALF